MPSVDRVDGEWTQGPHPCAASSWLAGPSPQLPILFELPSYFALGVRKAKLCDAGYWAIWWFMPHLQNQEPVYVTNTTRSLPPCFFFPLGNKWEPHFPFPLSIYVKFCPVKVSRGGYAIAGLPPKTSHVMFHALSFLPMSANHSMGHESNEK